MKQWRSFALMASAIALTSYGFTPQADDLQQKMERVGNYVTSAVEDLGIPGASLAVVYYGEIVYARGWGVTGGVKRDVSAETPFLVGSNSKALTAFGIMLLVQDGKIKLDDPVQRHIPWFSLRDSSVVSEITIEQLIAHTSGLSSYSGFKLSDRNTNDSQAIQRAVRGLASESVIATPGQVYEYSAANYAVLGAVIEMVTGMTFAEFMEMAVFAPLEMEHAAANGQVAESKGWQPGYRSWFDTPVASNALFDSGGAPYGYIAASAEDMARFLAALQQPGGVLSVEHTEILLEPIVATGPQSAYGYGWRIFDQGNGSTRIWHGGSTPDFRSEIFMLPTDGWGVVLLTNRNNAIEAARLTRVSRGIERILRGEEPTTIRRSTPLERQGLYVLTGLLLVIFFALLAKANNKNNLPTTGFLWSGVAIVFALLSALFLPLLLHIAGVPWRSLRLFAPDLALLAMAIVTLCAGNGVLSVLLFSKVRSKASRRVI